MTNARLQGKEVHLLGHAGDDLIDVLDEDVVQSEFPDYPGHAQARRQWAAAQRGEPSLKAGRKKQWYAEHFRVPNDVVTYQKLGDALAAAGRRPAALAQIVDGAVKLASAP